ncbi:interleukin-2 receptor subunit beta isoform X2 [Corythoichthys intestinalis]|uniref:interleukin-2 receptor subunit beta isoform X2 n=1 Tax=Corythoichthys intestinalis TaxID=161448 RepID=UPI0025A6295B|nr:interleukin-2 receptor subunit beta isoform X2 [Corythoichthys intestinalis]
MAVNGININGRQWEGRTWLSMASIYLGASSMSMGSNDCLHKYVMMETAQLYFVSAILFCLHFQRCETNLQGLTCVNDFINNVTCTLNSYSKDLGRDCMIFGYKKIRLGKDRLRNISKRSCVVKQCCNSLPGCSFVFERNFSFLEKIKISMECHGVLVENLTDYEPSSHIKMHPPSRPFVNYTDKDLVIYWDPGSPRSKLLREFSYEVQIQKHDPMRKASNTFPTNIPQMKTAALELEGEHYIRVKVKPADRENSQWSDWSPSASWVAPSVVSKSAKREWRFDQTFIIFAALIILIVVIVVMLIFYKSSISKRFFKVKPVPNPSKYLKRKTLLNPNCAGLYLHTAHPPDHISPVEVCESKDEVTSTFATSANRVQEPPNHMEAPSVSGASSLVDNSSSSSCFSNLGYFVNGSSGSSVQTKPNHVYFAYKDEFHIVHKARNANLQIPLHLCTALAKSPSCESLKRGAQSPDSGFCTGKEDEEITSDSTQTPTLTANVSAAGWPVASTTYRPSSMPVESCKTGYFILQEIQTTSRNASI